MARHRQ